MLLQIFLFINYFHVNYFKIYAERLIQITEAISVTIIKRIFSSFFRRVLSHFFYGDAACDRSLGDGDRTFPTKKSLSPPADLCAEGTAGLRCVRNSGINVCTAARRYLLAVELLHGRACGRAALRQRSRHAVSVARRRGARDAKIFVRDFLSLRSSFKENPFLKSVKEIMVFGKGKSYQSHLYKINRQRTMPQKL